MAAYSGEVEEGMLFAGLALRPTSLFRYSGGNVNKIYRIPHARPPGKQFILQRMTGTDAIS